MKSQLINAMTGFPTCNKRPLQQWRHGMREQVCDLFESYDQVGIVPAEQGCVVLDVDIKHGVDGRESLKAEGLSLAKTLHYKTQSGGFHVWYRVLSGVDISQRKRLEGIDIRYADGYVCVGKDYLVQSPSYIAPITQELQDWLCRDRDPSTYEANTDSHSGKRQYDLSPIPAGQRNNKLYSWGYGLLQGVRKGELSEQDLHDLIHLRGRISNLPFNECELILSSLLSGTRKEKRQTTLTA